jgi:hypothetical protein
MTVEVKNESGYWSVYVDNVRTVDRESYTVANNVAEALRNPLRWEPTEAYEVAGAIEKWRASW